jgi:hypothetical protein
MYLLYVKDLYSYLSFFALLQKIKKRKEKMRKKHKVGKENLAVGGSVFGNYRYWSLRFGIGFIKTEPN